MSAQPIIAEPEPTSEDIEITGLPELSAGEESLVEMHSVLNVLNVLGLELELIGLRLTGETGALQLSLARCREAAAQLGDPARALEFAAGAAFFQALVIGEIEQLRKACAVPAGDERFRELLANLTSIMQVLLVRARETRARAAAPDQWVECPIEQLRGDFHQIFAAIEQNSHGRYRIIYNVARQLPTDYFINFTIESAEGRSVAMPLLFKDVMRDLVANARKYTRPGGSINVGLYETAATLRFVVQDTGCGIPPDEIREVVHFGRRGSNVAGLRTMGGGFGLTKAGLVARRFGGRLWIRSRLGVGTRITLQLPRPGAPR